MRREVEGVHLARKPRDSMNLPRLPSHPDLTLSKQVDGPALPVTIVILGQMQMEPHTANVLS